MVVNVNHYLIISLFFVGVLGAVWAVFSLYAVCTVKKCMQEKSACREKAMWAVLACMQFAEKKQCMQVFAVCAVFTVGTMWAVFTVFT